MAANPQLNDLVESSRNIERLLTQLNTRLARALPALGAAPTGDGQHGAAPQPAPATTSQERTQGPATQPEATADAEPDPAPQPETQPEQAPEAAPDEPLSDEGYTKAAKAISDLLVLPKLGAVGEASEKQTRIHALRTFASSILQEDVDRVRDCTRSQMERIYKACQVIDQAVRAVQQEREDPDLTRPAFVRWMITDETPPNQPDALRREPKRPLRTPALCRKAAQQFGQDKGLPF